MKNIFTLLLLSGFSTIVVAQNKTTDTTKVTQSRIKVYSPTGISEKSNTTSSSYSWVVKTDVLKFVTGEIPIIYERKISSKLSVEGAAGVTYSFFANDYTLNGDEDESSFESKAAFGTVFRGTLKYYPSSDYDAIEGWSFGIQLFTKVNNREYDGAENGSYTEFLKGKKDSKSRTGIALIISQQLFQDSNICLESFLGLGYANVKSEYYTWDYDDVNNAYAVKQIKKDEGNLNIQFGFRIGFGN